MSIEIRQIYQFCKAVKSIGPKHRLHLRSNSRLETKLFTVVLNIYVVHCVFTKAPFKFHYTTVNSVQMSLTFIKKWSLFPPSFALLLGIFHVFCCCTWGEIVNLETCTFKWNSMYLDKAGTGTPLARIDAFPRTTGTSALSEPPFKYVNSWSCACLISSL